MVVYVYVHDTHDVGWVGFRNTQKFQCIFIVSILLNIFVFNHNEFQHIFVKIVRKSVTAIDYGVGTSRFGLKKKNVLRLCNN